MTEELLDILKIAFLALLYLFFARVLWTVWSEVRAPRPVRAITPDPHSAARTHVDGAVDPTAARPVPAPVPAPGAVPSRAPAPSRGKRGRVGRLVVIEPRARRGMRFGVGGDITIGRSPDCTIHITDDAFISNLHARVYAIEGALFVEDLGSTNGSYLNGSRLTTARPLGKGDRLQVGGTVLEAQ
jgi:hypothetical protein